jgi:hypothetical protein
MIDVHGRIEIHDDEENALLYAVQNEKKNNLHALISAEIDFRWDSSQPVAQRARARRHTRCWNQIR